MPASVLTEPNLDRMRVLTLNLFGRRASWPDRRQVLIAGLRALRPDLVAFVEAIKSDSYDQVRDLLGPNFYVAHQQEREPGGPGDVEPGQGASIACRWPLRAVQEVDLHVTPRTADFACTTLIAEVAASDPIGPLLFVNHVPNWQVDFERERELQAVVAAQFVEELVRVRDMHVILAGDFTADPISASVRYFTGRQSLDGTSVCYRDAWESARADEPGHTFVPDNPLVRDRDWPFRRLDYVLVRGGMHRGPTLDVAACDLAFDQPIDGVWASDHFGVVADLTVPRSHT